MSSKGLNTKNEAKEDAEEEHEEDKDGCSEEEDESAQMSDSHWDCSEAYVELPPHRPLNKGLL